MKYNKALHLTAIPLRCITAGELGLYFTLVRMKELRAQYCMKISEFVLLVSKLKMK